MTLLQRIANIFKNKDEQFGSVKIDEYEKTVYLDFNASSLFYFLFCIIAFFTSLYVNRKWHNLPITACFACAFFSAPLSLFYFLFLAIYYTIVKTKSWCFKLPADFKNKDLIKLNKDQNALVKCIRGIIDTTSTTVSETVSDAVSMSTTSN